MPSAWADTNCRQVNPARRGAGSMPACLRSSHTVLGATRYPSCTSSPWIRRYPQVGLSAAIRKIRRRSPCDVDGRPGGRCGLVQWRLRRADASAAACRGDEAVVSALLGKEPGQGCEDGTIRPGGTWPGDLSAQHRDFLPEHQDLGVLGGLPAGEQCEPAEELAQDQVEESECHGRTSSRGLHRRCEAAREPRG
jgi:hypothetical protein